MPYRFGGWLDVGQVRNVIAVHRLDGGGRLPVEGYAIEHDMRQSALRFQGKEPGSIRIEYEAGIDLELHPQVKTWLLMQAAALYAQRETLTAEKLSMLPDSFINTMLSDITVPPRF